MTTKRRLLELTEEFLEALVAHRAAAAPLAVDARATHNGVEQPLGSAAIWSHARRLPARQTFVDPERSTAVFFGVLSNSTSQHASVRSTDWFYVVRLGVVDDRIHEVEELTFEGTWAHYQVSPDQLQIDPRFEAILPEDERSSRDQLVAAAEDYLQAVARTGPASAVAFHPDARRVELGQPTTDAWNFPHSARGDFSQQGWRWAVHGVRFPVADTSRGVLVAFFGLTPDDQSNPRFGPSIVAEVFKIESGLIRRLFAIYCPGTGDDGWSLATSD